MNSLKQPIGPPLIGGQNHGELKVFRGRKKMDLGRFLVDAYTRTTSKFSKSKSQAIARQN